MSLLSKPKMNTRWKKMLLVAVSLLLLVPCVAAAAFNVRFDLESVAQEPSKQDQVQKEKELEKQRIELSHQGTSADAMKKRSADPAFAAELERRKELELQMREVMHAALVRLARISMEHAIQVATSQHPGKVLTASLGAKGWEEPGKLGKDGQVFYHVLIADETSGGATHVWVNAIDGTILRTDKELPRKQRSPENQ